MRLKSLAFTFLTPLDFLPRLNSGEVLAVITAAQCAGKSRSLPLCTFPPLVHLFPFCFSLKIFHLTTHPSPFNESPKSLIGCNPICYILHNLTPCPLPPPKPFSSQVCSDFCRILLLFKFCDGSAKFLWSVSVSPQVKQSFANFTALLTSTPPLIIASRGERGREGERQRQGRRQRQWQRQRQRQRKSVTLFAHCIFWNTHMKNYVIGTFPRFWGHYFDSAFQSVPMSFKCPEPFVHLLIEKVQHVYLTAKTVWNKYKTVETNVVRNASNYVSIYSAKIIRENCSFPEFRQVWSLLAALS